MNDTVPREFINEWVVNAEKSSFDILSTVVNAARGYKSAKPDILSISVPVYTSATSLYCWSQSGRQQSSNINMMIN